MERTDLRPKQRACYVSLEDPLAAEGYVDELCQNMGEEGLRLHSVVAVNRGGDTVGFWVFFTRVPLTEVEEHVAVERA
jgi:hypothetical protein